MLVFDLLVCAYIGCALAISVALGAFGAGFAHTQNAQRATFNIITGAALLILGFPGWYYMLSRVLGG